MKRNTGLFVALIALLAVLFPLNLSLGSVFVPLTELFHSSSPVLHQILFSLRLPKAITAVVAGASLSLAGCQMQTLFRNPLAGPYVLGVSSGATLGVAVVVLFGSLLGIMLNDWLTILAAVVGALAVLLCVLVVAKHIQSSVSLLLIGMMVGSIAGALVNVMQNFANPDSLKLFVVWTLGSLSAVGWSKMGALLLVFGLGLVLTLILVKPLNGLRLGENQAASLGIPLQQTRLLFVLATGCLAGGITAFCGPIAFVGVAVPHMARGLFRTSDHRITLPACALLGANLLLVCDTIANLFTYPLPISTVSALFGAPIVIHLIFAKKH